MTFPLIFGVVATLLCCRYRSIAVYSLSTTSAVSMKTLSLSRTRPFVAGPLWYRQLDEEDEEKDSAMLKVNSRTPFGFDVKKALLEHREKMKEKQPRNAINQPLIRALTTNQYLIVGLATAISSLIILFTQGPSAFGHLDTILNWSGGNTEIFDMKLNIERLLLGIGAAMPLLAFSAAIENSDNRALANINFSTIAMCLTLFGRHSVPPDEFLPSQLKKTGTGGQSKLQTTKRYEAAIQSFILSTATGFCEEAVFRRQVPAMLALVFGSNGDLLLPYFGQAILFGLSHAQPVNKLAENTILVGLQTFNGLGFGLLYILSGGDLVPCIIAHATYDFVVFFKTWNDANDKIEYAETMYNKPLPLEVDQEVWQLLRANTKIDPRLYNIVKRLFYIFDYDKSESLSLSEVRKGMSYMAIERAGIPPPQSEIDRLFTYTIQSRENSDATSVKSSRLTFPDFLRLLSLMDTERVGLRPYP